MILGKFIKQPGEVSDYDIDYSEWLRPGETLQTVTPSALCTSDPSDTAILIDESTIIDKSIRTRLSAGTVNATYKITLSTATSDGRVDESEFIITMREY